MARGERGSTCSAGVCTHHTVLIYQVCVKRKIINYSSLRQWNGHSRQRASTMWSWVPVALLSDREQDWGEHVHCPPKATRDWTRPSPTPGRTLLQIGGGACKDCKLSLSGSHRNGGHQSVQGVVVVVLRVDLHRKFALQLHERDPLEGHDARAERAGVLKRRTAIRVKPWPNGTQAKLQNQNLHRRVDKRGSQLEPSYKTKTCIGAKRASCTAKSSQLARNHSIVWIRPRSHITITNNLARVGWGGQTVENLDRVGEKFELDQIQANSIQLKPSGWPNDTQLHPSCELGSTWLELGGPFGQGFSSVKKYSIHQGQVPQSPISLIVD